MEYYFSTYDILRLVAKVEAHGVELYRRLQTESSDSKISEMWAFFADQEQQHEVKFLAKIAEQDTSADPMPCSLDIQKMLKDSISAIAKFMDASIESARMTDTVSESLALAAELETTSIHVYTHMITVYSDRFSDVLASNVDEEREHLRLVRSVQERLDLSSCERD